MRSLSDVSEAQVLLDLPDIAKLLPRILSGDTGRYDDVLALLPIDRCRNTLLISCLQAVDDPKDLCSVPARARGVRHCEANLLRRIDNEDRTDCKSDATVLLKRVEVVLRDHIVEKSDVAICVSDDWELYRGVGRLVDVVDPLVVRA